MKLTINGRISCTPSEAHHGEYVVTDTVTGKRLSSCVRTVRELHEIAEMVLNGFDATREKDCRP